MIVLYNLFACVYLVLDNFDLGILTEQVSRKCEVTSYVLGCDKNIL